MRRGDRLQDVAEIVVRHFDVKIFDRLEQPAVFVALENHFRSRNHHFVAFAPHLLDEDRDLHFAAGVDLESAGRLGVVDLERDVAARLADQSLAHVARGDELSFASGEGRIVDQNPHPDRRRIDIDELQRRTLLAIGQRLADVNFFKASQTDDIAGAGVLRLDLLQAGVGEKRGHVGALAAAVAMNANDRSRRPLTRPLTMRPRAMRPR